MGGGRRRSREPCQNLFSFRLPRRGRADTRTHRAVPPQGRRQRNVAGLLIHRPRRALGMPAPRIHGLDRPVLRSHAIGAAEPGAAPLFGTGFSVREAKTRHVPPIHRERSRAPGRKRTGSRRRDHPARRRLARKTRDPPVRPGARPSGDIVRVSFRTGPVRTFRIAASGEPGQHSKIGLQHRAAALAIERGDYSALCWDASAFFFTQLSPWLRPWP